jgi:putative phosphoesterase
MKIGVISDTHDRIDITAQAIGLLKARGAELLIHCGDIESPDIVPIFGALPTHFVFGNNDYDLDRIRARAAEAGGTVHGLQGRLGLAGQHIAWVHGHISGQLRDLKRMDAFDFLFYGHSHVAEWHRSGRTLVLNPGALFRARPKTCALVDLNTGKVELIKVAP